MPPPLPQPLRVPTTLHLTLQLAASLPTTQCGVGGVSASSAAWMNEQAAEDRHTLPEDDDSLDDANKGTEEQLKHQILEAALPFVHSRGWSQDAIAQGAESLGYSSMAHGMFPSGGVDLVNHFYAQCNTRLHESLKTTVNEMEKNPQLKKGTTTFIADAIEERLRMNIEFIDSWAEALALHASPRNAAMALRNIGTLVDHIWYHAGDRSYDFGWYTKRGILAAVYKSSELCMLQDKSEDFQDTWTFLNRRLSDVHKISKYSHDASSYTKDFSQVAKAGIFTARFRR
ncbi:ubiquinone biosynthesis protein COQ9, mitochondrial isoform X3 [Cherax quadricarinatus]|uniref:ubiquinone biosynthesis protein COQ9, mitochondrial isoform X3 n=1 Tax=Cherax quadricarinatus TaxID=27406 RepID=UPI00387EA3A9